MPKDISTPEDVAGKLETHLQKPCPYRQNPFPQVLRSTSDLFHVCVESGSTGLMGLDLEFNPRSGKPTIMGFASQNHIVSVPWDKHDAGRLVDGAVQGKWKFVGYSVLGADKPTTDAAIGYTTPDHIWEDAMTRHYLCNADLCQAPKSLADTDEESDPDEEEEAVESKGAQGFMNLWTASTIYVGLPQWKVCRGESCWGPCPTHDPFGYNGIDSWVGLQIYIKAQEDMKRKRIPEELYRRTLRLSKLTWEMQQKGVMVDLPWMERLEKEAEEKKNALFPQELVRVGKKVIKEKLVFTGPINPRSPKKVKEWFESQGISLKSTDKKDVRKALEKAAKKLGYRGPGTKLVAWLEEQTLPEPVRYLFCLDKFKNAGKGLKSWVNTEEMDKDGLLHPRFNECATSMGRLSSSGPNFQNVPARGFGRLVRAGIIARPGYKWAKADASNLELRTVLYHAGFDPSVAGPDAFTWLVEQSKGGFDYAAEILGDKPRQAAKSVAHGSSYLEGFKLLTSDDLESDYIKRELAAGAIRICHSKYNDKWEGKPWEFRGKLVSFTASNLADRLFHSHSFGDRKKCHELLEDIYMKALPMIRQWQRRVLEEIENRDYVQNQCGRYLRLPGDDEEDAKTTVAFFGQSLAWEFVSVKALRLRDEQSVIPTLLVHDEIDVEYQESWKDSRVKDMFAYLLDESEVLPGFRCPWKVKTGTKWLEWDSDVNDIPGALKLI